jgi:glycerol-3-phosphate dehydrogenase
VELPICREIHAILFEDKSPQLAVADLMGRALKSEES